MSFVIRAWLAEDERMACSLAINTQHTSVCLAKLCQKEGFEQSKYPGVPEDYLYETTYCRDSPVLLSRSPTVLSFTSP